MKRGEYSGFGRPRKLANSDRKLLKGLQAANPSASLRALVTLFEEASGQRVSVHTLRRELLEMGLQHVRIQRERGGKSLVPRSKPYGFVRTEDGHLTSSRRAYPSDLNDSEWAILEPLIPKALPGGRPEEYPRRELVNAMLYVLRNGCTWRAMPHDLPPWSTVYFYFRKWRMGGLWQQINDVLVRRVRTQAGRHPTPSGAVMDSQSVKTTEKGGPAATTAPSD
jgi:transposase